MKKYLYRFMILCISTLIIASCESEDDRSSKSEKSDEDKILEMTCVVKTRSFNNWSGTQSGDIAEYGCGDKNVIYTTGTKAMRQKESCSGFYNASHDDITISDILVVKYKKKDINYTTKPIVVRATSIDAYRDSCMFPVITAPEQPPQPPCNSNTCDNWNACEQCGNPNPFSDSDMCGQCNDLWTSQL
jgi:hypothetical protein